MARVPVRIASTSARVEVGHASHPVAVEVSGRIERTHLVLGSRVEEGAVLVELDSWESEMRLAELIARRDAVVAEAEAAQAEIETIDREIAAALRAGDAGIAELERRLEAANTRARHLASEADRVEALAEAGGAALSEAQAKRVEAQTARQGVRALEAQIERVRAESEQDRAARERTRAGLLRARQNALAQIRVLDADTASVGQRIDRARTRAQVSGRIGTLRDLQPGAVVEAGDTLAMIVPDGVPRVVAWFPLRELGRIRSGQPAELRLDAYPWTQFGSIRLRVARVANVSENGEFRTELEPAGRNAALIAHGWTGVVEIETERARPIMLVLRAAALLVGR